MSNHRARVEFYGTRTCGFCHAAERLLIEKGVAYQREDVGGNPARRRWLFEASGRRTVPQIFINGRPIGGYTIWPRSRAPAGSTRCWLRRRSSTVALLLHHLTVADRPV